jgi:hypothetical protein
VLVIGEENDENIGYDSKVLSVGMGKAFTDMQQLRSRILKFAKHMQSFNKHMDKFESGMHECKRVWLKKKISTNHEEVPPNFSPNKEYHNMQWKEEEELNPNHHVDNPYPTIERRISNKDPLSLSSHGELVDCRPRKTEHYNGVFSDTSDESNSFDTDLVAACDIWDHSPKNMRPLSNNYGRFASNAELSNDEVYFSAMQTPPRGQRERLPTKFEMGGWGRRLGHSSYGFPKYFDLASVQEEDLTFDYTTIHDF